MLEAVLLSSEAADAVSLSVFIVSERLPCCLYIISLVRSLKEALTGIMTQSESGTDRHISEFIFKALPLIPKPPSPKP